MEEVWEDISLSSLYDHPTTIITTTTVTTATIDPPFGDTNLQDPPRKRASTESSANGDASFYGSPATLLSPNSGPNNFHRLESGSDSTTWPNPPQLHSRHTSTTTSLIFSSMNSPFNVLTAGSSISPSFCEKRAPEKDYNYCDRRYKRMMKNRESAVRSRARKQAYRNELELRVADLTKENARLRRQQEKFCFEAPTQHPKTQTLSRTLTAPF